MRHLHRLGRQLAAAIALGIAVALLTTATARPATAQASTRLRLSSGYDVYAHTYHLATDDTTETLGEFNVGADFEARSRPAVLHQWHLRGEVTAGSQLWRESVDLGYRWRPGRGDPRLRADLAWSGRQYRQDSDYALSSDNQEARGELRLYPWRGRRAALDLRLRARRLAYRQRSVLEQDQREAGVAAYLTSRADFDAAWRVGLLAARRTYPDSTAIDRDVFGATGSLERSGERAEIWLDHRSERRVIKDPLVRPSAWLHWSELRLAVPAGEGWLVANLASEVWRYDRQTTVWFDAWRTDLELGYRWGDLLGAQWHGLLTLQHLAAGDSPEAYSQAGLRGGLEGHAPALSGILALELGRRWYHGSSSTDDLGSTAPADVLGELELSYSDCFYLEIWLMATWELTARLSLDLTASYQPQRHTERDDDTALGYGSVRLAWRP